MGWLLLALASLAGIAFVGVSVAKNKKPNSPASKTDDGRLRFRAKRDERFRNKRFKISKGKREKLDRVIKKSSQRNSQTTQAGEQKRVATLQAPKKGETKKTGVQTPPKKVVTRETSGVQVPNKNDQPVEIPAVAIKKEHTITPKEAKKTLRKIENGITKALTIKKPNAIVDTKIQSMINIDMRGRSKENRQRQNELVTSALMKRWDEEAIAAYEKVDELMSAIDRGDDPKTVLQDRPEVPDFKRFVRNSDKLITTTSEKYDFYHLFIKEKGEDILKLLGPIDPKREEIEKITQRVESKVDNINMSIDDFLTFVESDLAKLENMEREVIERQKIAKAHTMKRDLEKYKAKIASGKGQTGKTVDEMLEAKIQSMEVEGKILLANPATREAVLAVARSEWEKKATNAIKRSDSLIEKLKDKSNLEAVAKQMPKVTLDSWIKSAECRNLIVSTTSKSVAMHRQSEFIKKEFADNLGLLKDEALKKYVKEQMESLRHDISDPKVSAESFRSKSKTILNDVMERIQVAKKEIVARAEEERRIEAQVKQVAKANGIILQDNQPTRESKGIILTTSDISRKK